MERPLPGVTSGWGVAPTDSTPTGDIGHGGGLVYGCHGSSGPGTDGDEVRRQDTPNGDRSPTSISEGLGNPDCRSTSTLRSSDPWEDPAGTLSPGLTTLGVPARSDVPPPTDPS